VEQKYGGIEKGYPNLRRYFGKAIIYLQLVRPFTLISPLLVGLLGVLASTQDFNFDILKTCIYVGVTLMLAQAVGQIINQYADVEIDKICKPYRPLPSSAISKEEALGIAWLLAIISIARAFTVTEFFGLVTTILIFFAVFYSLSPFSPRRIHPVLNILWMAVSRGFLPMFAVWSIYGSIGKAWLYSILAFLWVLSLQATKDINDAEADKKFGIKTMPNTYGIRGFLVFATIVTILMYLYSITYLPYMLILVPTSILAFWGLNRKVKWMENRLGWILFYVGLSEIYLIMFVGEHIL